MSHTLAVLVAILAGGASRRMGADKARLLVDGEPLLERTARVAAEAGLSVLIAGRGRPADWRGAAGVAFVPDERPGQGPLAGIEAALRAAGGPVLVLPCDLPRLQPAAAAHLAAAARARPPRLGLALGRGARPEPLFAVYMPASLPLISQRLDEGRLAVRDVLTEPGFALLDAPPWLLPSLHNANEPGDLEGGPDLGLEAPSNGGRMRG